MRDLLPAEAQLTSTDLNPPMLETAKLKFAAGERVEFQQADATALPFGDRSFDVVVCQFGVMFFPDKEKSYREVRRVLTPGGIFIFSVWDAHRYNGFARIVHELLATYFPADPPRFYEVPFHYHSIDTIRDALAGAGLTDLRASVLSQTRDVADLPAFAAALIYGNPVIDQIAARGGADAAAIVAEVEAALRAEFGSGPSRVPLQTIAFEAKRG